MRRKWPVHVVQVHQDQILRPSDVEEEFHTRFALMPSVSASERKSRWLS
jgi:hypothetical protein